SVPSTRQPRPPLSYTVSQTPAAEQFAPSAGAEAPHKTPPVMQLMAYCASARFMTAMESAASPFTNSSWPHTTPTETRRVHSGSGASGSQRFASFRAASEAAESAAQSTFPADPPEPEAPADP